MNKQANRPVPQLETVGPKSETRTISLTAVEWEWLDNTAASRGSDRSKVARWLIQKEMAAESVHTA
jgi:hypothetical protein